MNQAGNEGLSEAPDEWWSQNLTRMVAASTRLACASAPEEVLRLAIEIACNELEFHRCGIWMFDRDTYESLRGTFGVDSKGNYTDERHLRIFNRHGNIERYVEQWKRPPYYFVCENDLLRDGEAQPVGKGLHFTAPLVYQDRFKGFLSVDDLLPKTAFHKGTGLLLACYASLVSQVYFQKLAEQEISHAEELKKEAEVSKKEFVAMISHEIRTPLNAMLGYAQLISLESQAEPTLEAAKIIAENGSQLLELLDNILQYSQLSEAFLRKRVKPTDILELSTSVVDSFWQSFEQKGISLKFKHEGDFPELLLADAVGLRQILSNLVNNALKFTDRGEVELAIQCRNRSNKVTQILIEVKDTGIGIPVDQVQEMFLPFRQLDSSNTRRVGGIGMGLAITERLVGYMGGRIHCSSYPGKGTTIAIDLAFEKALKEEGEKPLNRPLSQKSNPGRVPVSACRILLAEDNENNRNVLMSVLNHLGYHKIDGVADGLQAEKCLKQRPYDLFLTDIQMPGIDGLELTRNIRTGKCGPINADIPIVGITAFTLETTRDQCIISGMTDYIAKPVKFRELQQMLERLLGDYPADEPP